MTGDPSSVRHLAGRVRSELGQFSWVARNYASADRLRRQVSVVRQMQLPDLPRGRRGEGAVWAVSVVRDEVDVVGATIEHLLRQGIDNVLVADNGSVDGTVDLLTELSAREPRVHLAHDGERAHHQSEKITWLAHLAWRHGADWVVPFDADELLFAENSALAPWLRQQSATVVHASFHHMVATSPTHDVQAATEFVLDATSDSPGKVVARSHPLLEVIPGNHAVSRVGQHTRGLHIAHAIYRSPTQVARKFRQGMAAAEAGRGTWPGEHWVKGSALGDADVAEVWAAISNGRPEPRINFSAIGPMVRVQPFGWPTWDPDGVLSPR
jgi:Glycosyl transferase family 2